MPVAIPCPSLVFNSLQFISVPPFSFLTSVSVSWRMADVKKGGTGSLRNNNLFACLTLVDYDLANLRKI